MDIKSLYTMHDAAAECGVLVQTISRAVREGRLDYVEVGRKKLIPSAALSQYKHECGVRNGANKRKAKQ